MVTSTSIRGLPAAAAMLLAGLAGCSYPSDQGPAWPVSQPAALVRRA